MDKIYKKIIEQIVSSGKRIREKSGKIQDIGITKKNLTEEDIKIERELKQIVKEFHPKHEFCAEEENENFLDAEDVWVVDPNGQKISIKDVEAESPKIIFNLSLGWKDAAISRKIFCELSLFELYRVSGSHAVNDSLVACGKYNGVVCLAKDSFPYFASSLLIREAGGVFTNIDGEENIKSNDRVFIGGDKKTYQKLKSLVEKVSKEFAATSFRA